MTTPTPPTIADLDEQIAELKRQRDIASLDGMKGAQSVLKRASTGKVADDLEALLPQLPRDEMASQQVSNVISIIRQVSTLIDGEVGRVEAIVAPPVQPA